MTIQIAAKTLAALFIFATPTIAESLAPFKDRLFAYPAFLEGDAESSYAVVDYREARDINLRDEIPERRVKPEYVSLTIRAKQRDLVLETPAGRVSHVAVGVGENARLIVVYIHGQGGSRKQGIDDFTFGGNFNRAKNLVAAARGLYLSPDFSDFDSKGVAEVAALIAHYAEKSPQAPVVVACGSAGGAICWGLAAGSSTARLSGMLLLGSFWDENFFASKPFARKMPVFFGHGSKDKVFPVEKQEAFFRAFEAKSPGYPARFVRFETGTHGTPIRMTDWRQVLNWMLAGKL